MTSEPVRAGAAWLSLREPADAAARASELVDLLGAHLATDGVTLVHDLGCGTGSMARWLAPLLTGPQRWVLHDRDAELLTRVADGPPVHAADGAPVSVETRHGDITHLDEVALAGATLITASALLDMMTEPEVRRLVDACARAGCPVLITLTVVGVVELEPTDPWDQRVGEAFNAHQRRAAGGDRRLGPDAFAVARDAFLGWGHEVVVRPSPWRLGPGESALAAEWFTGWLAAACEQRPDLEAGAASYARRRLAAAASGGLSVTVHHQDLLARPG